jgi:CBS domain-containing membrane protein
MMTLRVKDLMTEPVFALGPDDSLAATRKLMDEHHVRHVPVVDGEGHLIGIVSHRDLLRHALIEQSDVPDDIENSLLARLRVHDLMTERVDFVTPATDIREAAQIMLDNKYGCLPVVLDERLVGILTESDFVRLFARGN